MKRIIALMILSLFCILECNALANSDSDSIIIDVYLGEPIHFDVLMEDLAQVKIIYLGEIHTIARHHALQAEILRSLADQNVSTALGMEMFTVDQQTVLDEWQKSNHDVEELIKELGAQHWTNLMDYKTVLETARELKIPILALNAPDKLVKKIAAQGYENLTDAEKALIPEHAREVNPEYDRLLRLRLQVHKAFQPSMLDRIVLAQSVRDAVMAKTIDMYLHSESNKTMVVIAGTGHLNYGFGIPEMTQRRTDRSFRILLPSESGQLVLSEAEKRQANPVVITHEDLKFIKNPIADYLHIIPIQEKSAIVQAK